jgi:VanZ family protein
MAHRMSPLRRLFVIAFWGALLFAYADAIVPGKDAISLSVWDKINHMAAFFTITFLARAAYPRIPIFRLFVMMAVFGAFIELSQAIPIIHRDAEWDDWFADMVATVAGLIVAWPFAILADKRRARRVSTQSAQPQEP